MTMLSCQNLSVGYEGRVVLRNLSFEVSKGDYLCIVGENGSGKSTLVKTILGLQTPLEGRVVVNDGLGRGGIGYLPQQTQIQKDFPASVREIVLSGCLGLCGNRPFYSKKEKEIALGNMRKMQIEDLSNHCYRELSGGQQQRVLLARALCAAQRMLLLDEPVSGLDPKVSSEMYGLLEGLNREDGLTIIMITHDIAAATRYASHIMHVGVPFFYGTRNEYLQSSQGGV